MQKNGLEIERKFLIRYPDLGWLEAAAEKTEIRQTYLVSPEPGWTERVRRRGLDGNYIYTHTAKKKLGPLRRIEREEEISEAEYASLLKRADPGRRCIEKLRYCLRENGLLYEIDLFPFWQDRAFLEIELEDEGQPICLPAQIHCIREVTQDPRYTNAALAGHIPEEEI